MEEPLLGATEKVLRLGGLAVQAARFAVVETDPTQ